MSPFIITVPNRVLSPPRVSGDEPAEEAENEEAEKSAPRKRG